MSLARPRHAVAFLAVVVAVLVAAATAFPVPVLAATRPVNTVRPSVHGDAVVGEVLTCSPGRWRGRASGFRFTWTRDGGTVAGRTTRRYRVSTRDAGARIGCTARPRGVEARRAARSATVEVLDTPSNTGIPTVSVIGDVERSLRCDPGSWAGVVDSLEFAWLRAGTPIAGADDDTLVPDGAGTYGCQVAARNTSGRSGFALSPVVQVNDSVQAVDSTDEPPTNTRAPWVSETGRDLMCSPGEWAGDGVEFSWSWTRDGSPVQGATTQFLVRPGPGTYACLVSGRNGGGVSGYVSSATYLLGSDAAPEADPGPVNTERPTISELSGGVLLCSPGSWDNTPEVRYAWSRDGSPVGGADTNELQPAGPGAYVCLVAGWSSANGQTGYVASDAWSVG